MKVKCEECGKWFFNFAARASHIKWIHGRVPSPPHHQCIVCFKTFRDSFDLKRHVDLIHEKGGTARSRSFKCPICECNINKKSAPEHFQQHGYILETETLIFIDGATFEQWKTRMEKETNSKFVKKYGQRTVKQGVILNEYCCHRSGNFKSRSKGVRKLKVSNKINSYCPAGIVSKSLGSGEVIVSFQKTHVGHINEVGRQRRTKDEKAEFASRVPLEDILEEIGVEVPCAEASVFVQQLCNSAQTTNDTCDLEKQKASLVAEVSEIILSVKSSAELEALKRHIAPLQFIINSSEDKGSVNVPQVAANMQEQANRRLNSQKKFYLTKKKSGSKKIEITNPSCTEHDEISFFTLPELSQDYTL